MQDATGQRIFPYDLVMFQKTAGAEHDRGLIVRATPGKTDFMVLCADGTEVVKKPCDLTVVDRSFLCPGTAVASVSDHGGQPGVVTGVTTKLDLVQLHGGGADEPCRVVATGVSPAEVRPVRKLTRGDFVVSGTWLGRAVEVCVDVDVLFDGGRSVCRVTNAADRLRVVSKKNSFWNRTKSAFFPGDRVAGDASVFRASRWLKGQRKPSHGELEGTVAKVKTGGVLIYWAASLQDTVSAPPPAYHPNPRKLTFFCPGGKDLMWFWSASARCYFRSRNPATARAPKKKHRNMNRILMTMAKVKRRLKAGVKWPMAVAGTCTTVDVLWQDGTRQLGVPSASLLRIPLRNEKDFFPGQRVVGKVLSPHVTIAPTVAGRVGVVKSLSYKDQTACVSWITGVPGEVVDTVTSTYDLARSPDHSFFYGDMVVSLRPRGNQESNKATNDLSWVGHIADLCDAPYIHVKWGDGTTSKVLLHEIAIIKPRSADEILKELGDWVSDDDDAFHKKAQEDMPRDGLVRGTTAMIGKVRNIIKAVIRTLGGMLHDQVEIYMLSSSMALASRPVRTAITEKIRNCSPRISDGGDCHAGEAAEDEVFHFKHFDVVQSPQDHHYLDTTDPGDGGGRKWLKRVQQEWKILETSLPDTIYVRGFEDRMDLLRAVMVGASGTPYQDGLFFFDLQLPPSYPATPPQVKYHSFGLRANPNLYPSGTVCLSLLNTTGGKGTELWSPEASSVLQVVVSIQGLVLIGQPYYNAGYTMQIGTPEGRRNELPYCENTYLVNLHTMLHLIRRPPVGFEAFVRDHFRRRGQYVLCACEAYLQEGCPVGTLDGEALATEASRERSCSVGFRLALANIVPRLVEAFALIGTQPGN
ncbi:unnamed protein product [Urochloa decumbens]|uniref:UBC core domain-containing protein n=1 Tax=Urochloa decumbens TaxID=240449 RepID=A0ABC9GGF5_9POAL